MIFQVLGTYSMKVPGNPCLIVVVVVVVVFHLSTVLKLSIIRPTRHGVRIHYRRMPSVLFSGLNSSGAVRTFQQLRIY